MSLDRIGSFIIILVLTVLSGLADAQGAVWAAQIWQGGQIEPGTLVRAALAFAAGVGIYFIVIRFFNNVGIITPEVQTAIYFTVMLAGVALISRAFFRWQLIDQIVAVLIVLGVGWLSVRTGGA